MLRKIGLLSCLIILLLNPLKCFGNEIWTSHYPPVQDAAHVKANQLDVGYEAWNATNPAKSLTAENSGNSWAGPSMQRAQRFHIDLGTSMKISRFWYVNASGGGSWDTNSTGIGVKYFTLWGTNTEQAFNDLTWSNDTFWIQLTTSQDTFDRQSCGSYPTPPADIRYITVTDADSYRYYAFKFSDNWYGTNFQNLRRVELQTFDGLDGYDSVYPPAFSPVYVKATSYDAGDESALYNVSPYLAADPSQDLVGSLYNNSWTSKFWTNSNQRFHVDMGSAKIIKRIYYENFHSAGVGTNSGVKNYTLWGSNTDASFADTNYANDTGWTQITDVSQTTFDQHKTENMSDSKFITVNNGTPFRYYAFKFPDNYGGSYYMGLRRIELQVETVSAGGGTPGGYTLRYINIKKKKGMSFMF